MESDDDIVEVSSTKSVATSKVPVISSQQPSVHVIRTYPVSMSSSVAAQVPLVSRVASSTSTPVRVLPSGTGVIRPSNRIPSVVSNTSAGQTESNDRNKSPVSIKFPSIPRTPSSVPTSTSSSIPEPNSDVASGISKSGSSSVKPQSGSQVYQGVFGKEIRCLMYGLGDSKTPYIESVELVEQLVMKFVVNLLNKAQDVSSRPGGKVAIEDIVFVLRKDRAKFARVKELLTVNDELKKAKKAIADLDSVPAT
ncbi:uncharacterized protein LOC142348461 [Convolutriloba macropyga]|uniref:uncharacterized protein LOC142348461 n=1 Tax=Convolutriloba macropyga TaxID=536237 RepID=UPI003F52235E